MLDVDVDTFSSYSISYLPFFIFEISYTWLLFYFFLLIDKTSGDATDWVYAVLGVTHSYGVELQPSIFSQNGFVLPPSYIEPVGKEVLTGMKTLASLVR